MSSARSSSTQLRLTATKDSQLSLARGPLSARSKLLRLKRPSLFWNKQCALEFSLMFKKSLGPVSETVPTSAKMVLADDAK